MSKEIIVIVKNKLMSIDTVLPILIELKEKYNISSTVVVNDILAHKGINKNIVIRDAINYVGREIYTEPSSSNKIVRKYLKIKLIMFLFYKLTMGAKVLHFGIFEIFPFSIIGKFFAEKLYFLQGSSYKHSYRKFNEINGQRPNTIVPNSKNIVAFNDQMRHLNVLSDNHKVFMFGSTRTRKTWLSYIDKKADMYFDKYHNNVDFSNGCIVLILAFFGRTNQMRLPFDSLQILLNNTIDVLDEIKGDMPVLIKPHVFTDLSVVDKAIGTSKGYYISYLHPSVLAKKANVFICNTYSTTMADATFMGVKTIEYSDYNKEILKMSKGRSTGHEYISKFINNDQDSFKKEMKNILHNSANDKQYYLFKEETNNDSDELLSELAK
jgi:hypothetical protein